MQDPIWWRGTGRGGPSFENNEGAEHAAELLRERATVEELPTLPLIEGRLLEPPEPRWHRLSSTVGGDGALVSVWCAPAGSDQFLARSASPWRPAAADLGEGLPVIVTSRDASGNDELVATMPRCQVVEPAAQQLPNDRLLIAGRRSRWESSGPELNGAIIDQSGTRVRRGVLGDGLNHVATTSSGAIWAGYSDTGVFGSNGWGRSSAPDPIGSPGLIRFDEAFRPAWEFDHRRLGTLTHGFDEHHAISEVYALNVIEEVAWAYYYDPFLLARVEQDAVNLWSTGVIGAEALLVDRDRIGLLGGYNVTIDRLVTARLGNQELTHRRDLRLVLPDGGVIPPNRKLLGRGSRLHVIVNDRHLHLDLADL